MGFPKNAMLAGGPIPMKPESFYPLPYTQYGPNKAGMGSAGRVAVQLRANGKDPALSDVLRSPTADEFAEKFCYQSWLIS